MCSANIGEDRLSPSCIWAILGLLISKPALTPDFFGLRFFRMSLFEIRTLPSSSRRRRSSSPVVFGNGRTHTGEVDGSGGSRLANYCLGAPAGREPQGRRKLTSGGTFFFFWGGVDRWVDELVADGAEGWGEKVPPLRTAASKLRRLCDFRC